MFETLIFFLAVAVIGAASGLFLDLLEKFGKKRVSIEGEYQPLFLNEEWYWSWFRQIPGILFAVGTWGVVIMAILIYG